MDVSILGQNIKRIREEKKISAYKLYKKAGVGAATISEIESGKRKSLSIDTVNKIAKALDVTTASLYSLELNTEYVVTDLYQTIKSILEDEEITINNKIMNKKEKEHFRKGVESLIDTLYTTENNTESVVTDLEQTNKLILSSNNLSLDDKLLTKKEKEIYEIGTTTLLNIIRIQRKDDIK